MLVATITICRKLTDYHVITDVRTNGNTADAFCVTIFLADVLNLARKTLFLVQDLQDMCKI